ncbi:MAG: YdeI/OmpD-associated family protein [Chitinophagaceae bacterium]|nr:YdeI/OmpD-associated family protein [Chitinophagaceae bacterium]
MVELKNGIQTFHAKSRQTWRKWLQKNHQSQSCVWLILYAKGSTMKSVYYSEAVEEALCFGWIDSKANKRDDESYYQFFAKRNPKSNWSKINKIRVEKLINEKQMAKAGLDSIKTAQENGTWTALDEVENIIIPADLQRAFRNSKMSMKNFEAFPRSSKKIILEWILNARKPETREKRIEETVKLAAKNIRANHYSK